MNFIFFFFFFFFFWGGGGGLSERGIFLRGLGWGYDETGYFWEAITKLDYFGELFLNILGLFLKVKIQNWIFFGGGGVGEGGGGC